VYELMPPTANSIATIIIIIIIIMKLYQENIR
jgi:hypothetical protein